MRLATSSVPWIRERSADSLTLAIRQLLAQPVTREETRAHALGFTWDATTSGQLALFKDILRRRCADGC